MSGLAASLWGGLAADMEVSPLTATATSSRKPTATKRSLQVLELLVWPALVWPSSQDRMFDRVCCSFLWQSEFPSALDDDSYFHFEILFLLLRRKLSWSLQAFNWRFPLDFLLLYIFWVPDPSNESTGGISQWELTVHGVATGGHSTLPL